MGRSDSYLQTEITNVIQSKVLFNCISDISATPGQLPLCPTCVQHQQGRVTYTVALTRDIIQYSNFKQKCIILNWNWKSVQTTILNN